MADAICEVILRDTFTVVLTVWAALHLVWVVMLLMVQLLQIAWAQTTWESMRARTDRGSRAAEAITSALVAGTPSVSGAALNDSIGSDPEREPAPRRTRVRSDGWFSKCIKLLGVDTFVATAQSGVAFRRKGNPFSRGAMTNCKDFWCDSAPYFTRREAGTAMLDRQVVNYMRMYETPPRMKARRTPNGGEGGMYLSVGSEDAV